MSRLTLTSSAVGHSLGGQTTNLLLGARLADPQDGTEVNLAEPRIKAGVLLAAPGRGGDALSEFAAKNYWINFGRPFGGVRSYEIGDPRRAHGQHTADSYSR